HPNVARCFCNSGISVGPPVRAADRRVRTACRQVCCLLLTQSGHLALGLLPRKNDDWTPLSNSRACVRALLYRPRPMAARFLHTRNDAELWPEDDAALAPRDDLVIWDASDPSSSCHKWRPYLVSPYMQSGNGAVAELSWVPAALPPTPAEYGADRCYDGFCSGRLPLSSEPGTTTPAICMR